MTPRPRDSQPRTKPPPPTTTTTSTSTFTGRDGLGAYLAEDTPAGRSTAVVFRTPHAVAIRDLFPKATVHCLLLPRAPERNRMHPFDALDDPALLAQVRADADRLRGLVAAELGRLLGRHSRLDAARNAVLDGDGSDGDDGGDGGGDGDGGGNGGLPTGRDWVKEVKMGVHAVPSMNHLHVHVLSRDMHSERMKHKKHYNSFTTAFFVPLEDFPLAADDPRRSQKGWPERPMVCWRCGRDFGRGFKELKAHLEDEFDEWKRE